jgi:pimeloyl-ACP methyl ester carboxylesterase
VSTVRSNDGTQIGFDRSGAGPPLILVGGAFQYRAIDQSTAELVERLAADYSVFHYDRRGRGESGDSVSYSVEREVEDLDALIGDAGGSAFVYGTSSGAVFTLEASARGLATTKLALWEPPFIVDDSRPPVPPDYKAQLSEMISAGRRGDAIEYVMTTIVGMPAEFVAPMRQAPFWGSMEAVAHTIVYEADVMCDYSLPTGRVASVKVPTLVLDGGQSPWLSHGADAVADALPDAQRRTLQGQPHNVAADAIAPALTEFFAG